MTICRSVAELVGSLPGVVRCAVWSKNQVMVGHVTVGDSCTLQVADIQHECLKRLGTTYVPQLIMLDRCRHELAAA